MNSGELGRAGEPVVQIPVALGGEAVVYKRETIAAIYFGKITKWNDPAIESLSRGVRLPDMPIVVVHRSDGSGTTYIFTDFLSSVSGEWKNKIGRGKSVQWPAPGSVGGKGNEGVAGQVRNVPGSIGYVELAYARENHMDSAAIENRSHEYVNCSAETVRVAAASKALVSASDFSIVDRPGKRAYPIAGYTWAMVYQRGKDPSRARMVHDALEWTLSNDGQRIAASLDYVCTPQGRASRCARRAQTNEVLRFLRQP